MNQADKKKLIATNSAIWAAGILGAFILPLIAESLSAGPARFLQVICFAAPLMTAMFFSNSIVSRAIGVDTDRSGSQS